MNSETGVPTVTQAGTAQSNEAQANDNSGKGAGMEQSIGVISLGPDYSNTNAGSQAYSALSPDASSPGTY